jgi:hypothetical protein
MRPLQVLRKKPEDFYDALKGFSRREFPSFKSRGEALTWLVKD